MLKLLSYTLLVAAIIVGIAVRYQQLKHFKLHKFIALIALSVIFALDVVYYFVSDLFGIPNLAWLLSYLCLVIAVHYIAKTCWELFEMSLPRSITWFSCLSALFLTAVFTIAIAPTPDWPDHDIPRTAGDAIFMTWLYLHVGIFIIILMYRAYLSRLTAVRENNLPARHLIDSYLISAAVVCLGFLLKAFVTVTAYLSFLPTDQQLILVELSRLLMVFGGITWLAGFFSPHSVLIDLSQITTRVTKWQQLYALRKLENELHQFVPPAMSNPAVLLRQSWFDEVKDPDFYLHHVLVSILDAYKQLSVKKRKSVQENRLVELLSTMPQDGDYKDLIHICQTIARRL